MSDSDWQPLASVAALTQRAALLRRIREFFHQRDVVEVQTPLLGKATVTDPDVDSIAVGSRFLQTSPEYFMKRLLVAGMPSCYQLASAFRQDEQGRNHNPEFTLLEWYRLGFDHLQLMREVAELVDDVLGPTEVRNATYAELVGDLDRPREELDLAFANACDELVGRWFITDYPAEQAALARLASDTAAARFEMVIDGVEIANGYWELLDAETHRIRFQRDNEIRRQRGKPEQTEDEAFLAALDAGLPSCAGVALGVDRLVMLALGADHLDRVLTFRQ